MSEILVGRHAVREALLAGRRHVHEVILAEGVEQKGPITQLISLCRERKVPVRRARRDELDRLGGDPHHQGVVAQVSAYPYVELAAILETARTRGEPAFLLALDSLQDPQNVGSLLRSAEAVGIHGVILPERRSAEVTPAVSRASVGAVEHLLVTLVTNLARTLEELKSAGVWVVGVEDRLDAEDYRHANLNMPLVLVMGSEGFGLRRLVAERCDLWVRIPMQGRIESLNVSVAGSIVLYQAWAARQREPGSGKETVGKGSR
jgi:23S rRNA (guanosine2251-2'-O)-methyltransferase